MRKVLLFSVWTLMSVAASVALLLACLHFGPPKIHFRISHQGSMHFDKASAAAAGSGDVTFHTLAGKPEHLYAYKGQVVILHRWGTWCAPCVLEMPAFQKLYDRYRNDPKVRFVVVASMNSPSEVAAFAGQHHYDLPFYIADDQDTGGVKVSTFPTTMIYDKRSDIRMVQTGVTDWARPDIMARIELLKQE